MADMIHLIRRLSLFVFLFLLITGAVSHSFLSAKDTSHPAQEVNCPIHSGMAQTAKAQPFTIKSIVKIGEAQDFTHAFILNLKISHPPTF